MDFFVNENIIVRFLWNYFLKFNNVIFIKKYCRKNNLDGKQVEEASAEEIT